MKKYFLILILGLIFILPKVTFAQNKIKLNFFYSQTCPHCAQEKKFLKSLETKYPQLQVIYHDVGTKESIELLQNLYTEHQIPKQSHGLVPISFIGGKYFIGFNQKTGQKIKNCLKGLINNKADSEEQTCDNSSQISLPIIGKINPAEHSPLVMAILLGGLDGFNACAMMALGFLLAVLIATGIRKRIFLIGGTFILVSGLVYFIFIAAWLNLFLVLEQIQIITTLIGIIVVVFAIIMLKDYAHGVVCKLCQVNTKNSQKQSIFSKIEKKLFAKMEFLAQSKISLPLILLGTAAVAAGINMVELVCSFGFPLAFTKILTELNLSGSQYYFYLVVYVIFYMLDDFLIFLVAVITLRVTGISQKYLRTIKLIAGIFLLALGLTILLKPELLTLT